MKKGCIYLVQPDLLLGTNRYKVGISESVKYNRVSNYGKKRRTLCIFEDIDDVKKLEKIVINIFNKVFKKINRNEYFEGNECTMIKILSDEVIKYKYNNVIDLTNIEDYVIVGKKHNIKSINYLQKSFIKKFFINFKINKKLMHKKLIKKIKRQYKLRRIIKCNNSTITKILSIIL